MKMNLVIDIGNTRTKVFVFAGSRLSAETALPGLSLAELKKFIARHPAGYSILSSVVQSNATIASYLMKHTKFIGLNHKTPLPLKNKYKTRETLGNDRIANAVGAASIFPKKNCLVIDAGTCVKYDFINDSNEYLGGSISPGLSMRYNSLHDYTAKLPLVKPSNQVKLTGTNTKESIISGVQMGMLNEMEGIVNRYQSQCDDLKVILTGGDADRFAHLLNFPIFAAPKLTAIGLNEILQHNFPKK